MKEVFRETYAIGFDLDGTLYRSTPEMNDRIRTQIAEKILKRRPDLRDISTARIFFEKYYATLNSGSKVLKQVGYENPKRVMEEYLATADILDLIERDDELVKTLEGLHNRYFQYLLTSSPEQLSLQKLECIGINPELFNLRIFGDQNLSKREGTAFEYAVRSSSYPADEHVYIGDRREPDILPAKNLGMKTIAVHSEIPEADLSLENIHDIEEVLL